MVATEIEITIVEVPFSKTQVDSTVQGRLGGFRGIDIFHNSDKPNPDPAVRKTQLYDYVVASTEQDGNATATIEVKSTPDVKTTATGTITLSGVSLGDTVSINGLIYTASDTKSNDRDGKFLLTDFDTTTASELFKTIFKDRRTGTVATGVGTSHIVPTNIVTVNSKVGGPIGNTITLVEISSSLATSGSGTLSGGLDADFVKVNGITYTAVTGTKSNNQEFSVDGSFTDIATDLALSITNNQIQGTIGNVTATNAAAIVTCVQNTGGAIGNDTTITTSDDAVLDIPDTGLFSGAADTGPVTVNVACKSVDITEKIGDNPVQFVGFFTGIKNDSTATFRAIQKVGDQTVTEYDIIYTAVGDTPGITVDLFVVSIESPEGVKAPIFPVLPDSIDPIQINVVQRTSTGTRRIYDYFMLSTQT